MQQRTDVIKKIHAFMNVPIIDLLNAFSQGQDDLAEKLFLRFMQSTPEEKYIMNGWIQEKYTVIKKKHEQMLPLSGFEWLLMGHAIEGDAQFSIEVQISYFQSAAALNYVPALLILSMNALNANDGIAAKAYAERAIELGSPSGGMIVSGLACAQMHNPDLREDGIRSIIAAADTGSPGGNYLFGEMCYVLRSQFPEDNRFQRTVSHYMKAAAGGVVAALYRLAQNYLEGVIVQKNLEEAAFYARYYAELMCARNPSIIGGKFNNTRANYLVLRILEEGKLNPAVVFHTLMVFKPFERYIPEKFNAITNAIQQLESAHLAVFLSYCKEESEEDVKFFIALLSERTRQLLAFTLYNCRQALLFGGTVNNAGTSMTQRFGLPREIGQSIMKLAFGEKIVDLFYRQEMLMPEMKEERMAHLALSLFQRRSHKRKNINAEMIQQAEAGELAYAEVAAQMNIKFKV